MDIAVTVTKREEVRVAKLRFSVAARYAEEDFPKDMPGLVCEQWSDTIDLLEGKLCDHPKYPACSIHTKVCDAGTYELLDEMGSVVATDDGYVPSFFPGDHFGDYIIFELDETGKILNWEGAGVVRAHLQGWVDEHPSD